MLKFLLAVFLTFTTLLSHAQITTGCERINAYLPLLKGKKVAIIANHTTLFGDEHLVDVLIENGVDIEYILSPEHGFRGSADAGEKVVGGRDSKTGLKVVSLYGSNKSPSDQIMGEIDVMVYDLQDVGVRYFTYISTMKYCMDAAAKHAIPFIVLDRPNPNGGYVDGPILDMKHQSFVGVFPIPIVYGMTAGELAQMAKGEGWVSDKCNLHVVKCLDYTRDMLYELPIKPSPNLPDMKSIYLYPSTCYFEATDVSLGRGTDMPFKVFGHPDMKGYTFEFTPKSIEGATNPPQLNKVCYGRDLSNMEETQIIDDKINLEYIIEAYKAMGSNSKFFNSFFEKLIGVSYVREMISEGKSAQQIRLEWSDDVEKFITQREKYLIYK